MGVLRRFDVGPVVRFHVRGLRAPGARRMSWPDRLVFAVLPVALGMVAFALDVQLTEISPLLAATALLVGAMLTVFVFLTNLRVKVSESEAYAFRRRLQRLVGSAAVSSLYVAGLALLASAGLAFASSADVPLLTGHGLRRPGSALIVTLLAHLAVNLLTVIRRVFAVYFEVFGADFSPDLSAVPDPSPTQEERRPPRSTSTGTSGRASRP